MQSKTFRLFISSPFSDFEKEREVLHKKVFPRIDEHCSKHKLSFQPVDLRWGVNEEAQLDQKTLEVCLEEVRACKHFPHPNFLIMAGDRYGYVPCPYMIEKSEFEEIINISNSKDVKVLTDWYKLDENQIYLRDDKIKSTAYVLQPRMDEYIDYSTWEKQENKLRIILQTAANKIFTDKENKTYQKYFLSATEQEVIEGICQFKNKTDAQKDCDEAIDNKYIFGYLRDINNANGKYLDTDKNLQNMADTFKDNLEKVLDQNNNIRSRFTSIEDYEKSQLDKFEKYITKKLIGAIDDQVKDSNKISELEQEILEQTKFLKDKVKGFQGREKTLGAIENYLEVDTTEPLVVHGPSGMGKSSLMAKAIESAKTDSTIFRFVGATANSTTIRNLLLSIIDELQEKKIIEQIDEYEIDENKFETQIKDILSKIKEKTTIFIDALDQLQYINYLNWLPDALGSNLKIILSVLNDKKYEKDTHYYNVLSSIYNNEKSFIDITKDSLEEKKEDLVIDLLKTENRQLDEHQTNYLLERWENANYSPLYLKIAIEEVKHWKADDISQILNDSTEGIITEYLENLNQIYHHEELLIKKVFGYIHASKDGLSEKELLQILSEDLEDDKVFRDVIINEYHEAIKVNNPRRDDKEEHILPISIWSRLHTQIKPFIIERNIDGQPLMKFFHRQFTTVVEVFYTEDEKENLHTKLADYFLTLQDTTKTWDQRYNNLHMLDEYPYQLFQSKNSEKLKEILFDLEFAGSVYDYHKQNSFREILEKASELDGIEEDEIHPWESFYREKEHLISRLDEKKWRPHQSLFQLVYEDGEDSPLSQYADSLLDKSHINFHWLKRHNRTKNYERTGLMKVLNAYASNIFEMNDGKIFSWSNTGLLIWNKEGILLKKLPYITLHEGDYLPHRTKVFNNDRLMHHTGDRLMVWNNKGHLLSNIENYNRNLNTDFLSDGNFISWNKIEEDLNIFTSDGELLKTLKHTRNVYGAKVMLHNDMIISWDKNSLYIWNKNGDPLKVIPFQVKHLNIYDKYFMVWNENTIQLWSANCDLLKSVDVKVNDVLFQNDKFLVLSDFRVQIWSSDGEYIADLQEYSDSVGIDDTLLILSNGNIISSGFNIWNHKGELLELSEMPRRTRKVIELSNRRILSFNSTMMYIWSLNGELIAKLEGHNKGVDGALEIDDGRILSWSRDRTLRIWSKEGKLLETKEGHTDIVKGCHILKDGRILSWSDDNSLRIWKSIGEYQKVRDGHIDIIRGVKLMKDDRIISWGDDNTVRIWKDNTNTKILENSGTGGALVMEDNRILSWSGKKISIWSDNGNEAVVMADHSNKVSKVFMIDTDHILSCAMNTLYIWNINGKLLHTLKGLVETVNGALPLGGGNILVWSTRSRGYTSVMRVWNHNGEKISENYKIQRISDAILLGDDKILSWNDQNESFYIMNSQGNILTLFDGHDDYVNGVIKLENNQILSWSKDSTLRVWDYNGNCLEILKGHTSSVQGVKKTENGQIVSWSDDNTLRVWNSTYDCIDTLHNTSEHIILTDINGSTLLGMNNLDLLKYDVYSSKQKCLL